ncbi:MAG: hypothetical protein ACRCUP_00085 [Mycoplasmatales bacterium]
MSKNNKKAQILTKKLPQKSVPKNPIISFTYLTQSSYGFDYLLKEASKSSREKLRILEKFCHDFNKEESIEEAIRVYSSHSGEYRQIKIKNFFGNRIEFPMEHGNIRHLHLCKGTDKGRFVVFGFQIANRFEIIAFDPEHKLSLE